MTVPILVTGADRSGTTLLYTLLASHPRIMMVRRTNLWRWFDGKFGDLADRANLEQCLEMMMRYERLSVLDLDPPSIVAEFETGEPTYGRLFETLFSQQASRLDYPRWGDKSLHTELAADRVFSEWPHARMIQVIRDPRDRYASVLGRADPETNRNASIVARWIRSTRAALRNRDRYPDRYLVLRYEDLVADPETRTREVCRFVGEEFDPVMMEMRGGDLRSMEGSNSSFDPVPPGVISTRSVGRYASALSPRTVSYVETLCGPLMESFGYESETRKLGLSESMRHYGDVIDGAVRIPAWLIRERYQERRATVPDHRLADDIA
jgi:hypothetical protein